MQGKTMLLVVALGMSGCVTVPDSPTELVETATNVRDYCYQLPPEEVRSRIENLLSNCYGEVETAIPIGATYAPIKAGYQVINEVLPDGNRYSVRNHAGFTFSVDVLAGDQYCETRVHMYAVTGLWEETFTAVNHAVNGREVACP